MKTKKHPWDETMVIVVMVVSVLCILVLLANYIGVVGNAAYQLSEDNTFSLLSNAITVESSVAGRGSARCNQKCGELTCIVAHKNNQLISCSEKIKNAQYQCLCTDVNRPTAARPYEKCDNGIDDDRDGLIDCQDEECSGNTVCLPENCDNGADDNGNGLIDCEDEESCSEFSGCISEVCDNNIDDDGDGFTDCQDNECLGETGGNGFKCCSPLQPKGSCPEYTICDNKECVECKDTIDCEPINGISQECISGRCQLVDYCDYNEDCKENQYCDLAQDHICKEKQDNDQECYQHENCKSDICQLSSLQDETPTCKGELIKEQCISICEGYKYCNTLTELSITGPTGVSMNIYYGGTGECINKKTIGSCLNERECLSEECIDYQCVASETSECQTNQDCESYQYCNIDNQCSIKEINGQTCKDNNQCESNNCENNICTEPTKQCSSIDDCNDNEFCCLDQSNCVDSAFNACSEKRTTGGVCWKNKMCVSNECIRETMFTYKTCR
jgi:hypothetical protein